MIDAEGFWILPVDYILFVLLPEQMHFEELSEEDVFRQKFFFDHKLPSAEIS